MPYNVCAICGDSLPPRYGRTGRPRKYCASIACQTEAHRIRTAKAQRKRRLRDKHKRDPEAMEGFRVGDRVVDTRTSHAHRNAGVVVDLNRETLTLVVQRDCDPPGRRIMLYCGACDVERSVSRAAAEAARRTA